MGEWCDIEGYRAWAKANKEMREKIYRLKVKLDKAEGERDKYKTANDDKSKHIRGYCSKRIERLEAKLTAKTEEIEVIRRNHEEIYETQDKRIDELEGALEWIIGACGNPTIEKCSFCGRPNGLPAIVSHAPIIHSNAPSSSSMRLSWVS